MNEIIPEIIPNEIILTPNFLNGEPSLKSTRKKNKEGKCCFHHCNNPLSKEEYEYMGFLACEECGKKLLEEKKRLAEASLSDLVNELCQYFN